MAGISGKLSNLKYMRKANRHDTRRQKTSMAARLAKRAWKRAERREGKQTSRENGASRHVHGMEA
jgi:hypothetical protein